MLLTSFYTFTAADGTLQKLELDASLNWWQGLEDAHRGLVYIHGYGDRKLGEHKGIKAVSAQDSHVQWEEKDLSFYGLGAEGLLAYPTSAPENAFVLLDFVSGKILRRDLGQQEAIDLVNKSNQSRHKACTFPLRYREGEEYYEQVKQFLMAQLPCEPLGGIEYAETTGFVVCAYYEKDEADTLKSELAVFDLDGNLYLHETLGTRLKGLGSDSFFIFKGKLYFIRNRSFLAVHSLQI